MSMPNSPLEAAEQARDRAESDLVALGALTDSNFREWNSTEHRLVAAKRAVSRLKIAASR